MNENDPIDPRLAALLDSASLDEPTDAELAELDWRMAPQLAATVRLGATLAGGGGVILLVAAAVWWALSSAPAPLAIALPVPPPPVVAPAPPPPAAAPSPPPPAKKAAKRPEPTTPTTPAPPEAPRRDPADELVLLEQAQKALAAGDARSALDRVAEHEREFSDGVLVQEREVLAVQALLERGEREPAQTRAARFFERYPTSVHLPKVRALLRDGGS